MQVLYDFPDDSALKLTIAKYLTPGDVSIQEVGIVPDIELVPGETISGKVEDERGEPVADAAVRCELSRTSAVQGTERISRLVASWEEGRILDVIRTMTPLSRAEPKCLFYQAQVSP